jgi:phosphatidylglycerophosphatase C
LIEFLALAMSDPIVVVAFDFDGTLTHHDSVIPFIRRFKGIRPLVFGLLRRTHQVIPALLRRDRDALRGVATQVAFTGRTLDQLGRHAAKFGADVIATGMRADMVDRLVWHRDAGHTVLIVSASYEQYVRVVGRHLGVHDVLATKLESIDGILTGRLDGANCRGPEKVQRLQQWCDDNRIVISEATVWAYGDSAGDRELLAIADHPIWVTEPLGSVAPSL